MRTTDFFQPSDPKAAFFVERNQMIWTLVLQTERMSVALQAQQQAIATTTVNSRKHHDSKG